MLPADRPLRARSFAPVDLASLGCIYNIERALADKTTVPIYYESRIAKLDLDADELLKPICLRRPRWPADFSANCWSDVIPPCACWRDCRSCIWHTLPGDSRAFLPRVRPGARPPFPS